MSTRKTFIIGDPNNPAKRFYVDSSTNHVGMNVYPDNNYTLFVNKETHAESGSAKFSGDVLIDDANLNVGGSITVGSIADLESYVSDISSNSSNFSQNEIKSGESTKITLTTNNVEIKTNSTSRMVIDSNGNVGIGKTDPSVALDVSGNATISGTLGVTGVITSNAGINIPGSNVLHFGSDQTKDSAAGKIGYGVFGTGNSLSIVGKGTTSDANSLARKIRLWDMVGIGIDPTEKLDVNGTALIRSNLTVNGTLDVSNKTGTGNVVFSTSPTLVTPALGTPASGDLQNCDLTSCPSTSFPTLNQSTTGQAGSVVNGVYTTNNLSALSSTTSAQLRTIITDETGSGSLVFATSPTLVTPNLGTPLSGNLANCTFPNLSALSSSTSAHLRGIISDETGSGSLVFATSPTLVTPVLGTPSSGDLRNCDITNCTFPTLNQNTTGSAAKLTTARTIGGVSFDGSSDISTSDDLQFGTLGIGTTSGSYTLNVNGDAEIGGFFKAETVTIGSDGTLNIGSITNSSSSNNGTESIILQTQIDDRNIQDSTFINYANGVADSRKSLCLQPYDGNVGIGTIDPTSRLYVDGDAVVSGYLGVNTSTNSSYALTIDGNIMVSFGDDNELTSTRSILFGTQWWLMSTSDDFKFFTHNGNTPDTWTEVGRVEDDQNASTEMNFTGQHRTFIENTSHYDISSNKMSGLIVCADKNKYVKMSGGIAEGNRAITQNESLPLVSLSMKVYDKSCFGVISESEDPEERIEKYGAFCTPYDKEDGDTRVYINSLGEGAIWVSDICGNLESGDYITTSNIPGYGMKQESEFLANYTVAKITMDCDFDPKQKPVRKILKDASGENILNEYDQIQWEDTEEYEYAYKIRYVDVSGSILSKEDYDTKKENGESVHKAAYVGCTYHCG